MPVEIRELNVRAVVNADGATTSSSNNITQQQLEVLKKEIKKELLEELKDFLIQYKER